MIGSRAQSVERKIARVIGRLTPLRIALALLPIVAFCEDAADVTSRYYVQDGLLVQYDGIENSGRGLHDATTNRWVDLTGNGPDFVLIEGKKGKFTENAFSFDGPSAKRTPSLPSARTFETCVGMTSGRWVISGHDNKYDSPSGDRVQQGLVTVSGTTNTFQVAFLTPTQGNTSWLDCRNSASPFSTSVLYVDDPAKGSLACYCNGSLAPALTGSNTWKGDGNSYIGVPPAMDQNQYGKGLLHSVRLYDRRLTEAEIARNALVDAVRFKGAAIPASLAPDVTFVAEGASSGVTFRWSVTDFGWLATGFDKLTVTWSESSDFTDANEVEIAAGTFETDGAYVLTGLPSGATCYARLTAVNNCGASATTETVSFALTGAARPAVTLRDLEITPVSARGELELYAVGEGATCGGYYVVTCADEVLTNTAFVTASAPFAAPFSADVLKPETDYALTLVVTNAGGAADSVMRSFRTPGEGFPAYGYIRNGLILQLDAIDNAAAGGFLTHDANATGWLDLAGAHVFEPAANGGIVVKDDHYLFPAKMSYLAAPAADLVETVLTNSFTVETLTKYRKAPASESNNYGVFSLGSGTCNAPRLLTYDTRRNPSKKNCGCVHFNQSGFSESGRIPDNAAVDFTADLHSALVCNNAPMKVYVDGTLVHTYANQGVYNTGGNRPPTSVLGVRSYDTSTDTAHYCETEYRAFRFYNRALTTDELVRNRAADRARFFGGPVPTLTVKRVVCANGAIKVTVARADGQLAAPIGVISSADYGKDVFTPDVGGFAAGETETVCTIPLADGVKFVRLAADACVTPTIAVGRFAGAPNLAVKGAVANSAVLKAVLTLLADGEVTCHYGAADAGPSPDGWDGSIDCGACAAGENTLGVTGIPSEAAYVRFATASGEWSEPISLATVRTDSEILVISSVEVSPRSVRMTVALYGDSDDAFDFAVSFGESVGQLEPPVVLASDCRLNETFTVRLNGLRPDSDYVIRPVVDGREPLSDDLAVRTGFEVSEIFAGHTVLVADDPQDDGKVLLTFDAPGEEISVYCLADAEDRGVDPADWASVTQVATVAADATSVSVPRVAGWGESVFAVRYYLGGAPDSSADYRSRLYATAEGGTMFGQWDGVDNAGFGVHDATLNGLKDLRGEADLVRQEESGDAAYDERGICFTNGAFSLVGTSALPRQAIFNNSFTAEMFLRLNRIGESAGVLAIGKDVGERILMFDSRAEKISGDQLSCAALQYRDAGWNDKSRVATGLIPYGAYLHLAIVCTSSSAKLYVNGEAVFERAVGSLASSTSDRFCVGKYYSSYADFNLSSLRFHDRPLAEETLRANAVIDAARFTGVGALPRMVLAESASLNYDSSQVPVFLDTDVSGEETGDRVTVSGHVGGAVETVEIAYRPDGAAEELTAAAEVSGTAFAVTLDPVLPGTNYSYRLTARNGAFETVSEGNFRTLGAALVSVSDSRASNGTASYSFSVTRPGVNDTRFWIEVRRSDATDADWMRVTEPLTVAYGVTLVSTLTGYSPYLDTTVQFRLVASNACTRVEHGSWVSYLEPVSCSVVDNATYTFKAGGSGLWGDASNWSMNTAVGWGFPKSVQCSVQWSANDDFALGVDGQYAVNQLPISGRNGSYAVLSGAVENASIVCNMTGGTMMNTALVLRGLTLVEANGVDFGNCTKPEDFAKSGDNFLWLQEGTRVTLGGHLQIASSKSTELRLSGDAELVADGIVFATANQTQYVRFEGASPRLTLGHIGYASYMDDRQSASMMSDVMFVYDVPAGLPRSGYAVAPVMTTGEGDENVFGTMREGSTGRYVFFVDPRSAAFADRRGVRLQLAACRAGIDTNRVVFAESGGSRKVTYSYTYGWPSVQTAPAVVGELPTGIRAKIAPAAGLVISIVGPSSVGATEPDERPMSVKGPSYSAVLLGDLHFDGTEKATYHANYSGTRAEFTRNYELWKDGGMSRSLLAAAGRANGRRAAMVLQLGDLVQGDCNNSSVHAQMLADAAATVTAALPNLPFATVCGNHDVRNGGTAQGESATYAEFATNALTASLAPFLGGRTVDSTVFSFRYGRDLFVGLDYWKTDPYAVEQILLANADARYVFVLTHAPVLPMSKWVSREFMLGGSSQTVARRRLRRALARANAIVLAGHVHTFEHHDWYGDGGRITEAIVNCVGMNDSKVAFPAEPNVTASTVAEYGKDTTDALAPLYDEYRPGLATCWESNASGHYRLDVSGSSVKLVYFGYDADEPTKTLVLR